MKYVYVRVSTKEQKDDRQFIALKKYGIAEYNTFTDKQRGKDFARQEYQIWIQVLQEGEILVGYQGTNVFGNYHY